jgi:threonine dehydrogenase-like Zn-dependent dehydrogenase
MRALLYGDGSDPDAASASSDVRPELLDRVLRQPVRVAELDEPICEGEGDVVLAPRLAGVCGSDARLLLGEFSEGDLDNPMAAFSVLPFVLGHEVVAEVLDTCSATSIQPGARVVLNPWLSCAPRGLAACAACTRGDLAQCERFLEGCIGPGLHVGVAADAPGAFATRLRAHDSQLHVVPDGVDDRSAVLADPFSVSLHAITRTPPPERGRALVVGAGALGTMAVAVLRRWYPAVEVAVLTRYEHQRAAVARLGAAIAIDHEPREVALEELARWSGAQLRPALAGLPMSYPGGVDVVYDTVGTAESLELSVRALRMRGRLVLLGVATPRRFEWTPIYFKELGVTGSSGFGIEVLDGVARHAIDHYLQACTDGLDLSWLVTHTEGLERWPAVCATLAEPEASGVLKASFAPQGSAGAAEPRSSTPRASAAPDVAPS